LLNKLPKINLKIIAILFFIFYILVEYLSYNFFKQLIINDAKRETVSVLNTINAVRNYVENIQKPVIYKLKKEKKLYHNFFDPKIMSSSYITRSILEKYAKKSLLAQKTVYKYKLAATNPLNPLNKADKFETKILNKFRENKINEFSTIMDEDGRSYFFTAIPIERNKKSCLTCHSKPDIAPKEMVQLYGSKSGFGEKVGDLRAMISLKVPVKNIVKLHIKDFILGSIAVLIVLIIFFIFIYLIYKKEIQIKEEKLQREKLLQDINRKLEIKIKKEVSLNLAKQEEIYEKERLLAHQNRLATMGEMICNIAHQWRQPLTQISSILMNIEFTFNKKNLTSKILMEKIDEADEQITFMSNTIDDFRNFFSLGKSKEKYNISIPIKKMQRLLKGSLEKNNITLRTDIENDFILYGYQNEIAQALLNIISNAKDVLIERKIDTPTIHIKAYSTNYKNFITIEDNAGGIKTTPIDKIFEPYFSTKHASIGTGIGLYMTKMIIEKNNNAFICVDNTHLGAIFTIKF